MQLVGGGINYGLGFQIVVPMYQDINCSYTRTKSGSIPKTIDDRSPQRRNFPYFPMYLHGTVEFCQVLYIHVPLTQKGHY